MDGDYPSGLQAVHPEAAEQELAGFDPLGFK
jgi:hypothetical protein